MATTRKQIATIAGKTWYGTPSYLSAVRRVYSWAEKLKAYERKMKQKYGRTYTRKSMTNAERAKFEALMKKRTDAAFSALTKK